MRTGMRRTLAVLVALALGGAPFACASSGSAPAPALADPALAVRGDPPRAARPPGVELASTSLVDSGLPPPPEGKQLPEGGSLRPEDASLIPDAVGLPDAITPPMVRDASIPEARPAPLLEWAPPWRLM